MRKILIIFLIFNLLACSEQSELDKAASEDVKELQWILNASPEEDFYRAIDREDYRFLGIYGMNNPVPNISKKCINVETDVNYIKGTSEVLLGYEHSKLNSIAFLYAKHYNYLMLYYLKTNKGFRCDL